MFSILGGNILGRNKQQQLAKATEKLIKEIFGGTDTTALKTAIEICNKEPQKIIKFLRNDENLALQLSLLQVTMNGFNGGGVTFMKKDIKDRACLNKGCVDIKFNFYFPKNEKGDELLLKFFKVLLENTKIKVKKDDELNTSILYTLIDFGLMKNVSAVFYEKCIINHMPSKIKKSLLDEINFSKSTIPNLSLKHLKMA